MKILMTGATGWVGRTLCPQLVQQGHHLICLVRNAQLSKLNSSFPATWIQWDYCEDSLDHQMFKGVDAILHLMGEPIAVSRWTEKIKKEIVQSRLHSTKKLKELAEKIEVEVFVSASAIGFYGDRGEETLDENSDRGEGFLADLCQDWEVASLGGVSSSVTRCVALRIGVVLGAGGGALAKMLPLFRWGGGGPVAGGEQWMSWIHLEDLQRVIIETIKNKKYLGVVNATSPCPVRQKEFARILGQILHRPTILNTPGWMLELALGEMAQIILSSSRVLPKQLIEKGFEFHFPSLGQALNNLLKEEE